MPIRCANNHFWRGLAIRLCIVLCMSMALDATAHAQAMRLGWQTGDVNTQLTFALSNGVFGKHGLKLDLKPFPAGPAILPALAAGEIDAALLGELPTVSGFVNGLPLTIVAILNTHRSNVRLVGRREAGIATIKDLKGKKVGVSLGSTSHFHLLRALASAGLTQQDVTLVNLAPAAMPPAYIAQQIDAALTWEPNIGEVEKLGAIRLATTESIGLKAGVYLVARREFLQANPGAFERWFAAWQDATSAFDRDPGAAILPEAKRLNMTPEAFAQLLARQNVTVPSYEAQLTPEYLGSPGQPQSGGTFALCRDVARFLVQTDRIKSEPASWDGLIDTAPMQAFLAQKH